MNWRIIPSIVYHDCSETHIACCSEINHEVTSTISDTVENPFSEFPVVISDDTPVSVEPKVNSAHTPDRSNIEERFSNKILTEVTLDYDSSGSVSSIDLVESETQSKMSELQRACTDFDFIIDFLEQDKWPDNPKQQRICQRAKDTYVLQDGLLYAIYQPKYKKTPDLSGEFRLQLCVPKCKRQSLVINYHDCCAGGGHFGYTRTFHKLRQKYWWPQMLQNVKDYISSCDTCQRVKMDRRRKPTPLQPLPIEDTFSRVHIDILGPLPKTKEGQQYILLIIDSFSKWSEAFPLVTQEASEIAFVLYNEFICRFGAPRVLVSDRGRSFMSKIVVALCELFSIKQHHTSSYHPQTNSTVERANSTLAKVLTSYVNENQTNWASMLPSAMMAFRSTPATESTGFSLFELVFGKLMTMPADVELLPKPAMPVKTRQFINELQARRRVCVEIARQNMNVSRDKAKEFYDKKAKVPDFKVHDKVLLHNKYTKPGMSPKLSNKYIGPFEIVAAGPPFTFKLKDCKTNRINQTLVNANRLKHYHERFDTDDADEITPEAENLTTDISPSPQTRNTSSDQNDDPLVKSNTDVSNSGDLSSQQVQASQKTEFLIRPSKVSKVQMKRGHRELYCHFLDGSRTWYPEHKIDEGFLNDYYKSHTKQGKSRKKKNQFYRQKKNSSN